MLLYMYVHMVYPASCRWVEYAKAKDDMFKHTDTKLSPW